MKISDFTKLIEYIKFEYIKFSFECFKAKKFGKTNVYDDRILQDVPIKPGQPVKKNPVDVDILSNLLLSHIINDAANEVAEGKTDEVANEEDQSKTDEVANEVDQSKTDEVAEGKTDEVANEVDQSKTDEVAEGKTHEVAEGKTAQQTLERPQFKLEHKYNDFRQTCYRQSIRPEKVLVDAGIKYLSTQIKKEGININDCNDPKYHEIQKNFQEVLKKLGYKQDVPEDPIDKLMKRILDGVDAEAKKVAGQSEKAGALNLLTSPPCSQRGPDSPKSSLKG